VRGFGDRDGEIVHPLYYIIYNDAHWIKWRTKP